MLSTYFNLKLEKNESIFMLYQEYFIYESKFKTFENRILFQASKNTIKQNNVNNKMT